MTVAKSVLLVLPAAVLIAMRLAVDEFAPTGSTIACALLIGVVVIMHAPRPA